MARTGKLVYWRRGALASQQVTRLLVSCLGHTYDRSIMVDGEEAALMVYDIWEQVRCRLRPGQGGRGGLGVGTCRE